MIGQDKYELHQGRKFATLEDESEAVSPRCSMVHKFLVYRNSLRVDKNRTRRSIREATTSIRCVDRDRTQTKYSNDLFVNWRVDGTLVRCFET